MRSEGKTCSCYTKSLPALPRECDRYSFSNAVGAALATEVGLLVDYGIVTDDDRSSATDRLWGEREEFRKTLGYPMEKKIA